MGPAAPKVETCLYVDDLGRAGAFYEGVLGLAAMTSDARFRAYDVGGKSVLLLFRRGATLETVRLPGGTIPPHDGHGPLHIAIDAQRNEFYLARYLVTDSAAELKQSLQVVAAAEIKQIIAAGEQVVGPDLSSLFAGATDLWPDAATLARLAAGRTDFVAGEQLEPIYLRPATFVKAAPPRIVPE